MVTQEPIMGRVAALISERELVINRGRDDGVQNKMRFAVLAATPFEIIDPETDEVIDYIDREKVQVEVTETREKTAVCATFDMVNVGGTGVGMAIGQLFDPARYVVRTLRIEDSSQPEPLAADESYVKIGDRVREVTRQDPGN